jgi:hypothetical protein
MCLHRLRTCPHHPEEQPQRGSAKQCGKGCAGPSREASQRVLGTGKLASKALKRTDRTLAFFIMALQGHDVIMELRNSTYLRGTVYVADVFMKCEPLFSLT